MILRPNGRLSLTADHRKTSLKFNRVKRSLVRWCLKRYFSYRLVSAGINSST